MRGIDGDMPLSEFEKAIIRNDMPRHQYGGSLFDWERAGMYIRKLPGESKMTLMQTPKTWRACRRCWGGKVRANVHQVTTQQLVTFTDCPNCQGKGMVFG